MASVVVSDGLDNDGAARDVYVDGMDMIGTRFVGTTKNGRLEGHGSYTFSNGSVYEGSFRDGQLHGHGKITYPNGQVFEGEWVNGKSRGPGTARGVLTFGDGLKYGEGDWEYCDQDDRRFYSEQVNGLNPGGDTKETDAGSPPRIPTGTFDVGDGYFEPKLKEVYSYDHKPLRKPSEEDAAWIVKHCRIEIRQD